MRHTIAFFETRGKRRLTDDDHARTWYADFLTFQQQERLFATLLTPPEYGADDCRWDSWRNFEFNEILAFYGLAYWYTWQVTILGLGPLWMSQQEALKRRAARLLQEGEVFAFGLSEQHHGADIAATEMQVIPQADGSYLAEGSKYYIGNAHIAPMVSTFGKMADTGDYVFFTVDYRHPAYTCIQNVCDSQNFVAEFRLHQYPIAAHDIVSRGQDAWDSVLNTVNIGKGNLGGAAVGMCTHALYEALNHAATRQLYGRSVTDFPHIKRLLIDAYTRLVAMKLFALRALDYMRAASPGDRRYILYNTIVKMKVTTQGEDVINLLADVIAAKGFEKDTYFAIAARDIRALPKLEGTVHVNLALIAKFIVNYVFNPAARPDVPQRSEPQHDAFLFTQGPARGLGHIQFHDYERILARFDVANVRIFHEQIASSRPSLPRLLPLRSSVWTRISPWRSRSSSPYSSMGSSSSKTSQSTPLMMRQSRRFSMCWCVISPPMLYSYTINPVHDAPDALLSPDDQETSGPSSTVSTYMGAGLCLKGSVRNACLTRQQVGGRGARPARSSGGSVPWSGLCREHPS